MCNVFLFGVDKEYLYCIVIPSTGRRLDLFSSDDVEHKVTGGVALLGIPQLVSLLNYQAI